MPAAGADAATGKATAAPTLALPRRLPASLDDIRHTARSALDSHNENARTGVDAKNRCGGFPASHCERPGVRAHSRHQATTSDGYFTSDAKGQTIPAEKRRSSPRFVLVRVGPAYGVLVEYLRHVVLIHVHALDV